MDSNICFFYRGVTCNYKCNLYFHNTIINKVDLTLCFPFNITNLMLTCKTKPIWMTSLYKVNTILCTLHI